MIGIKGRKKDMDAISGIKKKDLVKKMQDNSFGVVKKLTKKSIFLTDGSRFERATGYEFKKSILQSLNKIIIVEEKEKEAINLKHKTDRTRKYLISKIIGTKLSLSELEDLITTVTLKANKLK